MSGAISPARRSVDVAFVSTGSYSGQHFESHLCLPEDANMSRFSLASQQTFFAKQVSGSGSSQETGGSDATMPDHGRPGSADVDWGSRGPQEGGTSAPSPDYIPWYNPSPSDEPGPRTLLFGTALAMLGAALALATPQLRLAAMVGILDLEKQKQPDIL
ncbi:MAG: hypothetical protein Q8P84_06820 [Deltaproteobacteria bacterium]|nr:hypothetical protein [Deltaproteobacteria bacterium]